MAIEDMVATFCFVVLYGAVMSFSCAHYELSENRDKKEALALSLFWPISLAKLCLMAIYWTIGYILWGFFTVLLDWRYE